MGFPKCFPKATLNKVFNTEELGFTLVMQMDALPIKI